MEREKLSPKEVFIELLKDFGSLAIAIMTLGQVRLRSKEHQEMMAELKKLDDDTDDDLLEERRRLHPSMIKQRPGDFFWG